MYLPASLHFGNPNFPPSFGLRQNQASLLATASNHRSVYNSSNGAPSPANHQYQYRHYALNNSTPSQSNALNNLIHATNSNLAPYLMPLGVSSPSPQQNPAFSTLLHQQQFELQHHHQQMNQFNQQQQHNNTTTSLNVSMTNILNRTHNHTVKNVNVSPTTTTTISSNHNHKNNNNNSSSTSVNAAGSKTTSFMGNNTSHLQTTAA